MSRSLMRSQVRRVPKLRFAPTKNTDREPSISPRISITQKHIRHTTIPPVYSQKSSWQNGENAVNRLWKKWDWASALTLYLVG